MRLVPRLGRNSPCPCLSGRKFKHCHGRSADTRTSSDSPTAKASARLLELAGPIVDDPELDDDQFLAGLRLTMMAWNVAVLEATTCDTAEMRAKFRELGLESQIDALAQKKVRLFPDDLRTLFDLVVTTDPTGGRYVQVLSMN